MSKADLLWRLFVRHGRFADAASVLNEMAHAPGLNLLQRLEFLTKAVGNARSSTGSDMGSFTELLTELTDSLDVAKIQLEVYQMLSNVPGAEDRLIDLDSALLTVTDVSEAIVHLCSIQDIYKDFDHDS